MKHTATALTGLMILAACTTNPKGGSTVDLRIDGAGGMAVHLDRNTPGRRAMTLDSVVLDSKGRGRIHLAPLPLDIYRLTLGDKALYVAIDSTENLLVEAQAATFGKPTALSGSPRTQALHEHLLRTQEHQARIDSLRNLLRANPDDQAAIARVNELNRAFHDECLRTVRENSNQPVALVAIRWLDRSQQLDLYKKVRNDLRSTMAASATYTAFREEVDRLEQEEIARGMQEEELKRLEGLLPIGSQAPEIRQQTPDGGTLALSELRGKYVLIDFWASWCKPCRFENPAMKKVYDKYRKRGFEILGVSLDRDHAAWTNAIRQDGIDWKHVSDLGFWSNAAAVEYGVSSIPFTVLVDREGRIVAKGLRSADLDVKLAELLRS